MTNGIQSAASDFLGKTVKLAFVFAGIGFLLVQEDAVYYQLTGDHLSFVIELMSMLGLMFGAITAKNLGDNVISYQRDKVTYQQTGQIPAAPVKQG